MSKITIPAYKITEESMGDGWRDNYEAAKGFAEYLTERIAAEIADDGDVVECDFSATQTSGCVNNPCAYVTVDDVESDVLSYRVQAARERLWERFCNERADLAA